MEVLDESSTDTGEKNKINQPKEEWTKQHEKIFVEWADKAMCYRWLHNSAHIDYNCYNTWFTIPVIIISTVTGTANFAQERFADKDRVWVQVSIGTFNIIAAILTTVQQFLKVSELNEAHRVSSLLWGKYYRDIKMQMAINPKERKAPSVLLKHCKNEYDRLMEVSPIIPLFTIQNFKDTFSGKKRSKSLSTKCKMMCCNGYVCCERQDQYEYISDEEEEYDYEDNSHSTSSMDSPSNNSKSLRMRSSKSLKPVKKIKKVTESEKIRRMKEAFEKIHKPEICDELKSTSYTTYKSDGNEEKEVNLEEIQLLELKKKNASLSDSFIQNFANLNGREPTYIEYIDGVTKTIPEEYINKENYNNSLKNMKGSALA